ncbi:MAG: tetratricopeptide repeat protein, partial [Bacteroidia bacterium]|nr:tetratricopeptide repeat protein [Bacteroidia bacterium]
MKQNQVITILFFLATVASVAQTMKTKKWRKTEVDSLNEALLMYDEGNIALAYPIFEQIYYHHPQETYLKYLVGKLSLYRSDKYDLALRLLEESYAANPKIDNIHYDIARAYHYNYQFDKAEEHINTFLSQKKIKPEDKINAETLKRYIQNAKILYSSPTRAKVSNIGKPINTEWDEYVPVITTDETTIIYTYRGDKSKGGRQNASLLPDPKGIFFEDVFTSEKVLNKWAEPKPIETINTNSHDAAIALSPDGYMLFIYKDDGITHGDIYVSYAMGNNEFTPPQKLKGQVNSYSWEGSCSITADGKTL